MHILHCFSTNCNAIIRLVSQNDDSWPMQVGSTRRGPRRAGCRARWLQRFEKKIVEKLYEILQFLETMEKWKKVAAVTVTVSALLLLVVLVAVAVTDKQR